MSKPTCELCGAELKPHERTTDGRMICDPCLRRTDWRKGG